MTKCFNQNAFFFGFNNKTHCLFSSFHTVSEHECLSFSDSWKQQVQWLQWRIQIRLWCVWAVEDSSGDPAWTGGDGKSRSSLVGPLARLLTSIQQPGCSKLMPNRSKHCLCLPRHLSLVHYKIKYKMYVKKQMEKNWNNHNLIAEQVLHELAFAILNVKVKQEILKSIGLLYGSLFPLWNIKGRNYLFYFCILWWKQASIVCYLHLGSFWPANINNNF